MVRLGFGDGEAMVRLGFGDDEECEGNEALGFFSITLYTVYFMIEMAIGVEWLLVFFFFLVCFLGIEIRLISL